MLKYKVDMFLAGCVPLLIAFGLWSIALSSWREGSVLVLVVRRVLAALRRHLVLAGVAVRLLRAAFPSFPLCFVLAPFGVSCALGLSSLSAVLVWCGVCLLPCVRRCVVLAGCAVHPCPSPLHVSRSGHV